MDLYRTVHWFNYRYTVYFFQMNLILNNGYSLNRYCTVQYRTSGVKSIRNLGNGTYVGYDNGIRCSFFFFIFKKKKKKKLQIRTQISISFGFQNGTYDIVHLFFIIYFFKICALLTETIFFHLLILLDLD